MSSYTGSIMDFVTQLNTLQKKLKLEKKALDGAKSWAADDEFGMDKAIVELFKYHFKFHKLCFKNSEYIMNYIETTYGIEYEGEEIGYYSLFSELNGEPMDDMLVITDEDLKNS